MRAFRAITVLAVVFAASCGGGGDAPAGATGPTGTTGGGGPPPPPPSTTNQISVNDNLFSPASTQVTPGTTVTWTFLGTDTHNVTFASGPSSGNMKSGTFDRTFPNAGTFTYDCTLHPGMSGTIRVQ